MTLMQEIQDYAVPENSVAAWWLGQSGYIFKSAAGTLITVDPYLTNSVPELLPHLVVDTNRMQPIFIAPEELQTHVLACTHSHFDHADPLTIQNLHNKESIRFVGPYLTCRKFIEYGVPPACATTLATEEEIEFRDVRIRGAFALPTDENELNHIGFILTFADAARIYVTGDTDYSNLLGAASKHSPHVMITCINGTFNNLSHWEAAEVARLVSPRIAVPCHYDMFPDNAADPKQFRASLKVRAPGVEYLELQHAVAHVFQF